MFRRKSVDDSSCLTKIILNSEISDLNIVMARLKTIMIFFSGPVLNLSGDALRDLSITEMTRNLEFCFVALHFLNSF